MLRSALRMKGPMCGVPERRSSTISARNLSQASSEPANGGSMKAGARLKNAPAFFPVLALLAISCTILSNATWLSLLAFARNPWARDLPLV
jgi:hypothetical protein